MQDKCEDPGAWCKIEEAHVIYAAIQAQKIKTVYESGTCNGWSASWAALAMGKEGIVFTWDIFSKPQIYIGTNLEDRIDNMISPFHEGVKAPINVRPDHPIGVFIDGNHNTDACQADLDAVENKLRVNDLVFIHDTRRAKYDGIQKIFEGMIKQGMYEGINFTGTQNGIAIVRKCHKR